MTRYTKNVDFVTSFDCSDIDSEGPSSKRPRLDDGGDFSMAGMAKGTITKVYITEIMHCFLCLALVAS